MDEGDKDIHRVRRFLLIALILLVLLLLCAIVIAQGGGIVAAAALGIAILIASFVTGTMLGFLFSVPRVLARGGTEGAAAADQTRRLLGTNTNLERISDWLTTLLVGAGLTQLNDAGPALASFAGFVRTAVAPMGAGAAALPGLAPVILVAGSVLGFLAMYLYTRIDIAPVLNRVETSMALDPAAQRAVAGAAFAITAQIADPDRHDPSDAIPPPVIVPGAVTPQDALDVMFSLLYRPEGFKRVIGLVDQLRASSLAGRADFWFYAAAAYGQALTERRAAGDSGGATTMRARALEAAQRAVRIDPVYRSRLRAIADPDGPDDDLAGLADDPAFKAITG